MVGNSPIEFWSEPKKWANEQFAQKVSDSLICSFLVSNLFDLLTIAHSFFFFNCKKRTKIQFFRIFLSECSFFVSKRANARFTQRNKTFAHLSWVTWANCSHLLICHERPERFAHSRSFVLSDPANSSHWYISLEQFEQMSNMSKWAIWANEQFEQMSKWAKSKWANSQPCDYCTLSAQVPLKKNNMCSSTAHVLLKKNTTW